MTPNPGVLPAHPAPEGTHALGRTLVIGLRNLIALHEFQTADRIKRTINGFKDAYNESHHMPIILANETINFDFMFEVDVSGTSQKTFIFGEAKRRTDHSYSEDLFFEFILNAMKININYYDRDELDKNKFIFLCDNFFDLTNISWHQLDEEIRFIDYLINEDFDDGRRGATHTIINKIRAFYNEYHSNASHQLSLDNIYKNIIVWVLPIKLLKLFLGENYHDI